jgi:hypothetical protein
MIARLLAWLFDALLLALALSVVVIGLRLPLAERAAADLKPLTGLPSLHLDMVKLNPGALQARHIESPALGWTLDRLLIELTPSRDWRTWIRGVQAQGLRARVDLRADAPFAGLALFTGGGASPRMRGEDTASFALPTVSLTDAVVRIEGLERAATFRFNGAVERRDDAVHAAVLGTAATNAGTLTFSASGSRLNDAPRLHLEAAGPVDLGALPWPTTGPVTGAAGQAELRVDLDASLPVIETLDGLGALAETTGTARISLNTQDATLAPLAQGVGTTAQIQADLRNRTVVLSLTDPLRLSARRIDRDALAHLGLPPTAVRTLARTTELVLSSWSPGGELLELRRQDGRWRIEGRGSLNARLAPEGDVRLRAALQGAMTPARDELELAADTLDVRLSDLEIAGQGLRRGRFVGRAAWGADGLVVPGTLEATLSRLSVAEESFQDVSISAPIQLTSRKNETTLRLTDTGRLSTPRSLDFGAAAVAGPVTAEVSRGRLSLGANGLDGRFSLTPRTFDLRLGAAEAPVSRVRLTPGRIGLRLRTDPRDGQVAAGLQIAEASAAVPDSELAISGVDLDAQMGFGGEPVGTLTIGRIEDTRPLPRFAPLTARAVLREAAGNVTAAGTVSFEGQPVELAMAGRHDLTENRGVLRLGPTRVAFAPTGLQPGTLVPRLDPLVAVDGAVTLESTLRWADGTLSSPARIVIETLSFETAQGRVEDLRGTLRLIGIHPLESAPDQELTAARVVAGVPLDEVRARFALDHTAAAEPLVRIARLSGRLADGEIFLRDTTVNPLAARHDMTLRISGLSLARLFAQLDLEGVSGEGRLSGAVPLVIEDGRVSVNEGQLAAETAGVLRIRLDGGGALANQSEPVRLMLRAMEDFRYDTLALIVNRKPAEGLSMKVRMSGKNPDVLDGYPFEFNVSLTGDVEPVLLALQEGRRLTTEMLQRALEADKGLQ